MVESIGITDLGMWMRVEMIFKLYHHGMPESVNGLSIKVVKQIRTVSVNKTCHTLKRAQVEK